MIDVGSTASSLQVWPILFLGRRDIQAVMVRVVQEVTLDPPHFVVHLIPFDAWIGVDLHTVELQRAISRLGNNCRRRYEPSGPQAIQHLFAVGRNDKVAQSTEEWFRLARAEVKLRNRDRRGLGQARYIRNFAQKKHAGLACIETDVVCRFDRQRHDSLADSIQVDGHLHFLFLFAFFLFAFFLFALFLLAFFSFLGALVGVFGLVFVSILGLLIGRSFLFVALRFDRRGIALFQHDCIN